MLKVLGENFDQSDLAVGKEPGSNSSLLEPTARYAEGEYGEG
jgi:hypothetical protein